MLGRSCKGLGSLRGNMGVTGFTVWTRSRALLTSPHNVEEVSANREVMEGRREEIFLTGVNSR